MTTESPSLLKQKEQHPDTPVNAISCTYGVATQKATVLYHQACNGRAKQVGSEHSEIVACGNLFSYAARDAAR